MSSVNAKRTAKHERDAWQFRYDLCAEVGRCEVCTRRKPTNELAAHEVCSGNGLRQRALDKGFAILVLCKECHDKTQIEKKPRQLARLYLAAPDRFDLLAYNLLVNPRAPKAIELDEVLREVDLILENKV